MANQSNSAAYAQSLLCVGLVLLSLLLGGSTWNYLQTIQLIQQSQLRLSNQLADSVAYSLTDDLVTRDYGGLESRLKLILLNEGIRSAMVADLDGKVIVYLRREPESGALQFVYDQKSVKIPEPEKVSLNKNSSGQTNEIWKQIVSGMPVGWIRLSLNDTQAALILTQFKTQAIVIGVFSLLIVLSVMIAFLLKYYRKAHAQELIMLEKHDALEHDALHDFLTGLPNRKLIDDRIQHAIFEYERYQTKFVVCFLDLDGFKTVNDQYGHEVGDLLLIEVAKRLKTTSRRTDTIGRLGGDEFVLLLSNLSGRTEIEKIIQYRLREIAKPFVWNKTSMQVTASIGITCYPDDLVSTVGLLKHADAAMYEAKQRGKNTFFMYQT